ASLAEWRKNLPPGIKPGPKPRWRKTLSQNAATTYLNRCDAIKTPDEMFADAIAAKSYALAWQIRIEARAFGRPYVQQDPAANQRHNEQDVSRIAVAIKNLQIVQTPELPSLTKGKQLAAGPTIDAELPGDTAEGELLPE